MAQHDYSIANATGLNFRNDLNNALAAVVTQNSGTSEPNPAFPGQLWLDLSGGGDGIMRRRNQANNAWLNDIGVDQVARNAAATAQAKADRAILRDATATAAERTMLQPLVLPNTVPAGHEAVSRAQGDLLYQVKLPVPAAGSLLVGTAGGWTGVLPPGADGGLIVQSGGVPLWQNPATVSAPNAIVKTKADGTIDASFIPQIASGLKFCGTFKPVVNDEYPAAGDGGHGAGGAPAIGDFWVIDGLTTGGYTYLTGSLAGITVYNGDSIAFNGASSWYRMGSSVALQGYMKLDGSTAMAGNLDMGVANSIINVAGISGRPGPQVPLTNFKIDQTSILISPQRGATGADLAAMPAGQLGTDLGRMQLYVGAGASNTGLIPVRYFSTTAAYATGEYVVQGTQQYRAKAAVAAGAFTASQWDAVIDARGGIFSGAIKTLSRESIHFLNSTTGALRYYFEHDDTGWRLATCNDDGTFKGLPINIVRADGTVFIDRLAVPGYAGITGQLMVGPEGNSKFRFTASGGYTYMDIVTSTNDAYAQWRTRCWGIAFTLAGGNMQVGDGNIETNRTVVGNAGGDGVYASFSIGNDCAIWDVNRADTCQFRGGQNGNRAIIELGGEGNAGVGYDNGSLSLYNNSYLAHYPKGGAPMYECYATPHVAYYKRSGQYSFYWRRTDNGFPGGGNEQNMMELNNSGALFVAGTVTAANIPASDRRLKENIETFIPRRMDGLAFHSFDFIKGPKNQRGVIADEVSLYAPEYVLDYEVMEDDQTVTRQTVNYGSLALEVALNVLSRVIALEAAATPPPETLQ